MLITKFSSIFTRPTVDTVSGHNRIRGYRKYRRGFSKKRALLSYLTHPIISDLNGEKIVRFSSSGIVLSWARVLNELGYIVDIIDFDDRTFIPTEDYQLVIFHGGKNFDIISSHLKNNPKIIHFLTGSYWKFNNEQEDARIDDFKKKIMA